MPPSDPHDPWPNPPDDPYRMGESPDEPFPHEQSPVEPAELEDALPTIQCWRCGLIDTPLSGGRCRKCKARIASQADDWGPQPRRTGLTTDLTVSRPVLHAVILFAIFLLTSVIWGLILLSAGPRMTEKALLQGTAIVEGLDAILALVGLAWIGRQPLPSLTPGVRAAAWVVAVPVLILLFCGNVLYGNFLRDFIGAGAQPPEMPLTAITILLICVQPALIEELFFRYVAFGAIHKATGAHSTVWVTAVMFSVAHIYNPLGMPYLFVVGVVLGYARVWGGLALPMAMHFLHNLAVLAYEGV